MIQCKANCCLTYESENKLLCQVQILTHVDHRSIKDAKDAAIDALDACVDTPLIFVTKSGGQRLAAEML